MYMCVGLCQFVLCVCGFPQRFDLGVDSMRSRITGLCKPRNWVLGNGIQSVARSATLLTAELFLHSHIVIIVIINVCLGFLIHYFVYFFCLPQLPPSSIVRHGVRNKGIEKQIKVKCQIYGVDRVIEVENKLARKKPT